MARFWTRSTCRCSRPRAISKKVIKRIRKTSPDVIFSTVVGSSTQGFYEAYRAAGFDPARKMPIASLTTSEAEVAGMGFDAAEDTSPRRPFRNLAGSRAARRFVGSFKDKYGGFGRAGDGGCGGRLLPGTSCDARGGTVR